MFHDHCFFILWVEMDCVKFACDPRFYEYYHKYSTWDFAFMLNRNTYKELHEMINFAKRNISKRLLFPDVLHRDSCANRVTANLAGTGKTVIGVEIILQIFLTSPKGRILVFAPSNAGVDLIGETLMQSNKVPTNALRRLLGFSRNPEHIPDSLAASVQTGCEEKLDDECRIILTMCLGAAFLFQLVHDFTHIVMDEAGFCTEPEALMPLAAAAGRPDVQVVLAGDPNQLGPVIFSPFAKELGLAKSLMCRLLELPAYREGTKYCPFVVRKLDISYRAVPALLKIPSQLFYDEELKSSLEDSENVYAERLGTSPLTFWPVKSQEFRESRSSSIYNPGQVSAVTTLLKSLVAVGLEPQDIGIITPYRLQVSKIRDGVSKEFLDEEGKLKIGTVDEFQGQEKKAIILSTVRARKRQDNDDEEAPIKSLLGFVACPKRINVALTRAKFFMIIIGDPISSLWINTGEAVCATAWPRTCTRRMSTTVSSTRHRQAFRERASNRESAIVFANLTKNHRFLSCRLCSKYLLYSLLMIELFSD
ncbi:hypothetical protein RvY_06158-2 [Ramazzottius varieornatus]|uniref:Uncharacterized protein n=1 Tax=Ramazzottius varieornatus TaxID=947166 RepID=A0A1D1V151_RAMVA|nr:hypothetical protein RvY_06158-2 [Ramazzottius varieornatus]